MANPTITLDLAQPTKSRGVWKRRLHVFWKSWDARLSSALVIILMVISLIPRWMWPDSASEVDLVMRHQRPDIVGGDSGFLLGTDALGRDMLYRILMSTQLTLVISVLATILASLTGTAAGLAAGLFRGRVDTLISRLVDIMLAFPILLLVLALVAAMGRSVLSVALVLGLSGWAGYARVVRSTTLSLAEREFVESARCVGANSFQIISRHLLPNVASPILVLSTLNLAQFILVESAISFLGLGPEPPDTTWGGLIGDGRNYMYEAWWVSLFPGGAIFVTVLAFNLIGDAMRDAFDPYAELRG